MSEQDKELLRFALKVNELQSYLNEREKAARIKDLLTNISLSKSFVKEAFNFEPAHYCYQPLVRTSQIQLGAFGWLKMQREGIHLHKAKASEISFSTAIIRVIEGFAHHDVYDIIGFCSITHKWLITPAYQEVLKPGDVAIVYPTNAHAIGNKSQSVLKTIHLYYPPILKMNKAESPRFKIVPKNAVSQHQV